MSNLKLKNINFTVNTNESVDGFVTKRTKSDLVTRDHKYDINTKQLSINNNEDVSFINAVDIDWNNAEIPGENLVISNTGDLISRLADTYTKAAIRESFTDLSTTVDNNSRTTQEAITSLTETIQSLPTATDLDTAIGHVFDNKLDKPSSSNIENNTLIKFNNNGELSKSNVYMANNTMSIGSTNNSEGTKTEIADSHINLYDYDDGFNISIDSTFPGITVADNLTTTIYSSGQIVLGNKIINFPNKAGDLALLSDIPEISLSENYSPSAESGNNLSLSEGDTYEEAFSKLEKTINDLKERIAALENNN